MKVLRSLTALFILMSVLLTACSEPVSLLNFMPDESELNDISGATVDFGWVAGNTCHALYNENTPQYDVFLDRLATTENDLGCTINFVKNSELNLNNVQISLMAGTHTFDLLITDRVYNWAESELLNPMTSFAHIINLDDEKYGGLTDIEGSMVNGVPYGVSPVMWPGFSMSQTGLMAYNKDMFQSNGITELHEYYENGTWTWETYKNEFIAPTNIQNSDGEIINLLQTDSTELYTAAIASNNVEYVKRNEDGSLSPDPYSNEFQTAITWWQSLVSEFDDKIIESSNCHDLAYYRSQQALTCSTTRSQLITGNIAYNDLATFKSGVMPWPAGPDATYGEWRSWCGYFYGFCIPITSKEPLAAACVIEAISEPFEDFGGRDGLYDYYLYNIFDTEIDSEIFVKTMENARYQYEVLDGIKNVRDQFSNAIVNSNASVTEVMGKMESVFLETIEESILPNYDAVFGE